MNKMYKISAESRMSISKSTDNRLCCKFVKYIEDPEQTHNILTMSIRCTACCMRLVVLQEIVEVMEPALCCALHVDDGDCQAA